MSSTSETSTNQADHTAYPEQDPAGGHAEMAEKIRQGHSGDGVRYILAFSLGMAVATLGALVIWVI